MDAGLLVPGDRIALNAGANVPADSRVCKGMEIQVDQAALTGESLPVQMGGGDSVKMGSCVVSGENEAIVAPFTGINTFFGKTAALIGSTHDVGNFQKVIIRAHTRCTHTHTHTRARLSCHPQWPEWLPAVSFWCRPTRRLHPHRYAGRMHRYYGIGLTPTCRTKGDRRAPLFHRAVSWYDCFMLRQDRYINPK